MSLTPAQVQIIATTEPFASRLREIMKWLPPLLWNISLLKQRRRSRIVTRRKQRGSW